MVTDKMIKDVKTISAMEPENKIVISVMTLGLYSEDFKTTA